MRGIAITAQSEADLDRLAEDGKCAALILKQDRKVDYLDPPAFLGRLKSPEE